MTGNSVLSTKGMDSEATAERVKLIPAKAVRKESVKEVQGEEVK
jgi:hypothetical protein